MGLYFIYRNGPIFRAKTIFLAYNVLSELRMLWTASYNIEKTLFILPFVGGAFVDVGPKKMTVKRKLLELRSEN